MTYTVLPDAVPLAMLWKDLEERWPFIAAVAAAMEQLNNSATIDPEVRGRLRAELTFQPTARAWWEERLRRELIEALIQAGGHVLLAHDRLPPRLLAPESLRYVDTAALRVGTFSALDYRLDDLRDYFGARIFVPDVFLQFIRETTPSSKPATQTASRPSKPGRRPHPAQEKYIAWYTKNGFNRAGLTIPKVIEMIKTEWKYHRPSERAVLDWEKKARAAAQKQ